MKYRKRLMLDFDGPVHSYVSGWKGVDVISDPPTPGAFEFILQMWEHYEVVIHTSRAVGGPGWPEDSAEKAKLAIRAWLAHHGMPEKIAAEVTITGEKLGAELYIDDRAFCFRGVFPTHFQIEQFKPWKPGR